MDEKTRLENAGMSESSGRITPTARKLAERYGVSPEVMEEIITSTGNESKPMAQTPTPAPIPASPITAPPTAAIPVAPVPIASAVVPPATPPVVVNAQSDNRGLSAGAVLLGILLILLIAMLIYFRPWGENNEAQRVDTLRVAPLVPPRDTAELLAVDTVNHEMPIVEPIKVKKSHRKHQNAPHVYTTSSMLSAQEHLADLRASGNHKAYIKTRDRKGGPYYSVYSGK